MEIINKYRAIDGKLFDSKEDCLKYEKVAIEVQKFIDTLPDREKYNDGCSFSNGSGYILLP